MSDAKLLLGHLPAVWVGGTWWEAWAHCCGNPETESWKQVLIWRKDRQVGRSCFRPRAHPSGHLGPTYHPGA